MKPMFKLASAALLILSSTAFAAPQAATHPASQAGPASHVAPAPAPAAAKPDSAAGKKQIRAEEKQALAACKSMKGTEKTTCRKDAKAKAASAMAHLKDTSHG